MKLDDIETIRLLPEFMQDDGADKGLSEAVDSVIGDLLPIAERIAAWDKINSLRPGEADAIAGDLGIPFYTDSLPESAKMELITNADTLISTLGTVAAVEAIIKTYFGSGKVMEWFDYGGEPYHFKVTTGNASVAADKQAEFLRLIEIIKRKSVHFDGVEIALGAEINLHAGFGYHEVTMETVSIPKTQKNKPGGTVHPAE